VLASPYLEPGTRLADRYVIRREIGRGGFSVVYAAHDEALDTDVAVKLLVPPPAAAQVARERMRREVQAARGLSHANIVGVHDFAEDGAWSFIVMELVDGDDLQVRVRTRGPLSPEAAVAVGRDIAAALSAAHRRGILHRDVKPQNILIDADGRARLTDFGSARLDGLGGLTQTGAMVGTLPYTAPEIVAGRRGDARADLYALGVTLYEALAARLPGTSGAPGSARAGGGPLTPPPDGFRVRAARNDVPVWIDALIARATAAAPGARFPTADSLRDALDAGENPVQAPPVAAALAACVICGEPEPFGLTICAHCGGTAPGVADTIVYVRRLTSGGDRGATLLALDEALCPRAATLRGRVGALADLPLIRVPAAVAGRVTDRLAAHGLAARAVPLRESWRAVPGPLAALLATALGAGLWAGVAVLPTLLWTTPIVAALLGAAAVLEMRRPALEDDPHASRIPPDTRARLLGALAALPVGEARQLLARIVQLAEPLFASVAEVGDATEVGAPLCAMLVGCADVAVNLARLDDSLTSMNDAGQAVDTPPAEWMDDLARCERARDALVQRLLDAIATLGRLHGQTAQLAQVCAPALADWSAELAADGEGAEEAARDIAGALAPA
jgi:Protein kinase domain